MEHLERIGTTVDHFINTDVSLRGQIGVLYKHALEKQGRPLTLLAAEKLKESVIPGSVVIITTGSASGYRWKIGDALGESDGPPGAVVLARAISKAYNAIPVLVTEKGQLQALASVARAAGLVTTTLEAVKEQLNADRKGITATTIRSFPVDDKEARIKAKEFINELKPTAVISVEKSGMNEKGVYHDSRGIDMSDARARVDYLFTEAKSRGILTIGIGDGGNEIGMGLIREAVKKHIAFAAKCRCPCNAGLAPITETDVLVTAAVSNWGAYGIVALLSAIENQDLLQSPELEQRILRACADAGYIDPFYGYTIPSVDGLSEDIHIAFLKLLTAIIKSPGRKLLKDLKEA